MEELINKTQNVAKQQPMGEQMQTKETNLEETMGPCPEKENAGCLGIGVSFLLPLIGIIIYFVQRKKVINPHAYLYAVFIRIGIAIIQLIIYASLS